MDVIKYADVRFAELPDLLILLVSEYLFSLLDRTTIILL